MLILKASKAKQVITALVYGPPGECDSQGDYAADVETIEEASRDFMARYFEDPRRFRCNHEGPLEKWPVLENYVTDKPVRIGKKTVPAGCWIMTLKVPNPRVWSSIAAGKLRGLSIGGEAEG
jgi:hypothetical protein